MFRNYLISLAIFLSHWATFMEIHAVAEDPSSVVIVHGAWGGAHHWRAVDELLTRQHRLTVRRVSLTGLGERSHLATRDINLDTHIRDLVNVIEFDDLSSLVLVAHSYGGVVAQGVVQAIPDRIARVIYIDSHLLETGECYLTHHMELREKVTRRANEAGDGFLIPVDWDNPMRDVPHPIATLTQPIELSANYHERTPATYWLLADGRPPEQDDRHRYYRRAVDLGWETKVFDWNHNPQRDRPVDLTEELISCFDLPPQKNAPQE